MKEKTIDTKIDELTQIVTKGFVEVRSELGKEISGLGKEIQKVRIDLGKEIDDLAQMTAQGFTEVHKEMYEIRDQLKGEIVRVRGDVDIMLDKHIGIFRKDYDELTARVKDLEQV